MRDGETAGMKERVRAELDRVAPVLSLELRAAVAERSTIIQCGDGYRVFAPGDRCHNFLIALKGAVRVEHMGASGRSVVLYRIAPGDSCVMTTSCLLTGSAYEAYGYAEGDVEAIAMSAESFLDLVGENAEFRERVLGVFSTRIIELVEVIDELLLHRVDLRLATWLAEKAAEQESIHVTHQTIAWELGTAREVVSRILKDFERRGWIELTRGEVLVRDAEALGAFAKAR